MKTQKTARSSALILSVLILFAAFISSCEDLEFDEVTHSYAAAAGNPQTACLLHFVNDPSVDVVYLDDDVKLDRRAAANMISHRDGQDRLLGTEDDNLFSNLSEINHIKWVGESAIKKLQDRSEDWCLNAPSLPLGDFAGVSFSIYEGQRALRWLNKANAPAIERALGISSTLSQELENAAPFNSLGAITVILDSTDALEQLRQIDGW